MFAVCVTFDVLPDALVSFLPAVKAQARASLREELGCHRFDVCVRGETVFLYELYTDAAAFDVHLATEHFRDFDAVTKAWIVDKRVETYADVVVGM